LEKHAQRNNLIAACYLDGEPVASLALAYGLNPRTVANLMTLMGASRNEAKDERNEHIRVAYKTGERIVDIAKAHGLTVERALTIAVTTGKAPRVFPCGVSKGKRGRPRKDAQQ
jgi:transposase-like protein